VPTYPCSDLSPDVVWELYAYVLSAWTSPHPRSPIPHPPAHLAPPKPHLPLAYNELSPGVGWELYEYVLGRPPGVASRSMSSSFLLVQEDPDYDPFKEED